MFHVIALPVTLEMETSVTGSSPVFLPRTATSPSFTRLVLTGGTFRIQPVCPLSQDRTLSVVFKLPLRHLRIFCIFNVCIWMYYWHDYSLYNWAQMKPVNLINFTLSCTLSLCSCCWTIAARPQRADSSSNFCRTGHQRSRCLSLTILASPKTRCCIASTSYSVLGHHSVNCQ